MLAPLPIHFDASWHRYCWQPTGEWLLHSVTKVIGASKSESQKAVFLKTQHLWEPRGKHVHACLEAFLSGGPQLDAGDYGDWVEPLVAHPFWSKVTPLAIEYRVCDLGHSIGGSLDALVQHDNGKVLLLDLKTQSSARASTYSTDAQLGGYLSMLKLHHPALYVDECLTVWSKPGKSVITGQPLLSAERPGPAPLSSSWTARSSCSDAAPHRYNSWFAVRPWARCAADPGRTKGEPGACWLCRPALQLKPTA